MPARRLIVSFHDLHPESRGACDHFLETLRGLGVPRATLLVVPRWHGAAPCGADREFAAWLRARAAEGHEICLHAFRHVAEAVTGNVLQRALGRHYTAGEGEFHQITRNEAVGRLRAGLAIVARDCGVPVWGFTAPAWLLSEGGREALRATGFHYNTRWGAVELLQTGTTIPAPVLVWSTRAGWRRTGSRGWVRWWGALKRRAPVLRIAAHPGDFTYPVIEASLLAAIARHRRDREPACYRDLLPPGTPPVGGAA